MQPIGGQRRRLLLFPVVANTNRLQGDKHFVLKQQRGRAALSVYSLKLSSNPDGGRLPGGNSCERGARQLGLCPGTHVTEDGGLDASLPSH